MKKDVVAYLVFNVFLALGRLIATSRIESVKNVHKSVWKPLNASLGVIDIFGDNF